MLAVLEIMQRACQMMGIPAPIGIVASDYPSGVIPSNDQQIIALLYDVHYYLRNQRIFITQKRTHTFDVFNGVAKYPYPEDFFAPLLGTAYNDTTKIPLIGPLTDAQFDRRKYGLAGFSAFPAYRPFGATPNPYEAGQGQFETWPESGNGGDTFSYEYQTASLFVPSIWIPGSSVIAGEYRSVGERFYKVLIGGNFGLNPPSSTNPLVPEVNGTATVIYYAAPYDTIRSNSDQSIFDDYLVIAGLKAWYYTHKGQPQAAAANEEFGKMIDSARARFQGSFLGSMSRYRRFGNNNLSPQGGWDLT